MHRYKLAHKQKPDNESYNTLRSIILFLTLLFFNLIIVLGPFVAIMATIIAFYALAITLGLSSLLMVTFALIIIYKAPLFSLALFFGGVSLASFAILLGISLIFISKWAIRLSLKYVELNSKIIVGDKK